MPSVSCPHCGEPLDIPADLRGSPVRCAACNEVFTPPPAPAVRRAADDRPRYPDEDDDRSDDRPRRPRKKAGGSNRWVWILLGVGGLAALLCCGGFGLLIGMMMNPTFTPYTDPGGKFTVGFPETARTSSRATGRAGETAPSVESKRAMFQESYFVYHFDLPAADKRKPADKVVTELCDGLLQTSPGGRESVPRQTRQHDGHPAADIVIELPDDNKYTLARVLVADGRAYVVGVTGPTDPQAADWMTDFVDGFKVTPAKK